MIQEQLQALKNKKEILAARENRSHLQATIGDTHGGTLHEVQNVFQRWEGSVVSSEVSIPDANIEIDSLATDFEQEEDQLALKMMLDELTEQNHSDNH